MPHPEPAVTTGRMVETAHAKINIALHVRSRRDDGYHALESLFAFTEDGDRVAADLTADGAVTLAIDGPFAAGLDAGPDNLVMQASRLMQDHAQQRQPLGAAIRLTKNLPVASGIGGGSADAAATLRLLARLWDVPISEGVLAELSLQLGSDVPACVVSRTQLVKGRGDVIARHAIDGLAGCPALLINPGVALSTAHVFHEWDRKDRGPLDAGSLNALIEAGRNDLQAPAMAIAPVIGRVMEALRDRPGVLLARMSGSGATCFGLFARDSDRARAARDIRAAYPQWWLMETRIRTA